ncbi:lipoate--protein ligase family protein [Anaerobacillus isosaccharinicus]|uniref:Octanoyl-[GcvH]:protein N-octanoyltransferase n=1 Tax=Anaerobacillus isosaccharinicus TaxID=1532552 RepID=A0A1S2KYE1_9BACI|nr:lipoate--protein ligase family protein [Anaerobacillus isosaccharinicus]MBA5584314.1 lipoate--protein ligase family protein [Anaerobacillus isosaccharinicus]QOY37288.1 lipoate--protein ligase family protein [Anaerobacillus isosaccharinicus]
MSINSITNWRFIDQTTFGPTFSPLISFATDDTLCWSVGEKNSIPVIRTWVHHHVVILGIQDSRLPFINEGIKFLQREGYDAIVRNSGGLAVVLDEGILNISLIFKEDKQISINSGYDAMYELIQGMFKEETSEIEAKEIVGSYCPGSYDLSIAGKKFAGISQRRVRGGVAVQIYLCVSGSGSKRAALIKDFYELAVNEAETKFTYPVIVPSTMASLNELLGLSLTIQDVMLRLLNAIKHGPSVTIESTQLVCGEHELLETNLERMKKRNEGIG